MAKKHSGDWRDEAQVTSWVNTLVKQLSQQTARP